MAQVLSWIIPITSSHSVAVGEFELVHILPDQPVLFDIVQSPAYCHQVLIWQDRIVPVLDIVSRFGLIDESHTDKTNALIGICAYTPKQSVDFQYGALLMSNTPYHYEVSNEQSCDLPTDFIPWGYFLSSCFCIQRTQQVIPVLRLERLFASPRQ
jgi:hypothetical protein